MNTIITHASSVIDFVDIEFDAKSISNTLKKEVDNALRQNSIELHSGWWLIFQANYSNAREILVSKNRHGRYPSDKLKYVTILIPVPLKENISSLLALAGLVACYIPAARAMQIEPHLVLKSE